MKKKLKFIIISFLLIVSLYITKVNVVQAVSAEEMGKYVAEFAINFWESHNSQTKYGVTGRNNAYNGSQYNNKYTFDCVGWVSFAVHQATGYGNDAFTEFAIPFHGNKYPGFFNGYYQIYGQGGSGKSIPIGDLKNNLKPGDLLLATSKHVLIYVGDGTLIHSTGHGPGSEYGGDKGYALVKETLEHFYNSGKGIEAIGRIKEENAANVNETNLTTIFGESGKTLTGVWEKASSGSSTSGWDSSTGTTPNGGSVTQLNVSGMNEDYNLGLRYPKDNKNTPLNSFIDFTLPFLQNWMIPLAVNAGVSSNSGKNGNEDKNSKLAYLTLKEAMSDILVNRYDITKCTLKTRYKVFDVITYKVSHDEQGNKSVEEIDRYTVDESQNGPMAEEFISKNFDISTKYCIKKAYTFDVKIENEYEYEKYNDSDVENRIGAEIEDKENGGSYNEGGDPGGEGEYTYKVKQGNYINVTRVWQDKFSIGESKIEEYKVEDVKNYSTKTSNSSSYNSSGDVFECKKYDLTEDQKIRLAKIVYHEYGSDIEGMKDVASHMANLYEHRVWSKAISESKSLYDFISNTSWYDSRSRSNNNYNEDAVKAVEECIVQGKRTMPPYIDEFCTFASKYISPYYEDKTKYVQGETKVTQLFSGSPEGVFWKISKNGGNIYFYTSEKFKEYCEGNNTSTQVETVPNNINNENVNDLEYFSNEDLGYYAALESDKSINRVDLINSRPQNYLQYLSYGAQYSNHVGYSRGYLVFAYDELKRLFNRYFEDKDSLPFVYGSSLGYKTYTAKNELDAGTISGTFSGTGNSGLSISGVGDLTGLGIEIGTAINSESYKNAMKYYDIVLKYSNEFGLDPYLVIAMIAQESGGNPNSNGAAIGLMQWEKNRGTSMEVEKADGSKEKITFTFDQLRGDPDLQIKLGCAEFKVNVARYKGNMLVALQGYNYGVGGIKRCICHHISGGSGSGKWFGVSDEKYMEYIASNDTAWISSTTWYSSEGHKVFKNAGGGDPKYLSHILKYYNAEEAKKINT